MERQPIAEQSVVEQAPRHQRIGEEQVRYVAGLAKLELAPEELLRLTEQLDAIVGYVEQLEEVDTAGVEGTTHVIPLSCPLRTDEVQPSPARGAILAEAPRCEQDHFLVPKIIE